MERKEDNQLLRSVPVLSVTLLKISQTGGRKVLQFLYNENEYWAVIRNPEVLCGRLIQGANINIQIHPLDMGRNMIQEATLLIDEEDLLPEKLSSLFAENFPCLRSKFGFLSLSQEKGSRYYAILKTDGNYRRIVTGRVALENGELIAKKSDGRWNIRPGLVENVFYNQNWDTVNSLNWDHAGFDIRKSLDYLSLEDLTLAFRDEYAIQAPFEFYHSDDWSPEFYRRQAKLGFIAITNSNNALPELLPQLQTAYAVLHWKDLVMDKKVRKIINSSRMKAENIRLHIDEDPGVVLAALADYWEGSTWLIEPYIELLRKLASEEEKKKDPSFQVWGVTLTVEDDQAPAAGELGYAIGRTYTSLSGFFRRKDKKYSNFGKLQMVLLARELERRGFAFWNLGHPYMDYKIALGAKIIHRREFLKMWDEAV